MRCTERNPLQAGISYLILFNIRAWNTVFNWVTGRPWLLCLTGCDNVTWTARVGVASRGGTYHHYTSLSECQKKCLEEPTCIAVDVSEVVCIVHTDINDIYTTFDAPGYTQYRLNRKCPTSTVKSTSPATQTTSTDFGNITVDDSKSFYSASICYACCDRFRPSVSVCQSINQSINQSRLMNM